MGADGLEPSTSSLSVTCSNQLSYAPTWRMQPYTNHQVSASLNLNMMLVSHAIVGTAIGAAAGNPVAGFVIGVASHFVLDATPHFDPGSFMPPGDETYGPREYIWATADVLASVVALSLIALHHAHPTAIVAGSIGAMLPDIVLNTPFWKEWSRKIPGLDWVQENIHKGWHWTVPPQDWLAGILTQIIAIGGSLWLLGL